MSKIGSGWLTIKHPLTCAIDKRSSRVASATDTHARETWGKGTGVGGAVDGFGVRERGGQAGFVDRARLLQHQERREGLEQALRKPGNSVKMLNHILVWLQHWSQGLCMKQHHCHPPTSWTPL